MSRRDDAHRRVEEEIRREKAAALGRAGERLDDALREVRAIARGFDAATDPGARARLLRDYEAARAGAVRARAMLLIQREAVGLRTHTIVDQVFPEPPRRLGRG